MTLFTKAKPLTPYTLNDMAQDSLLLLDSLNIPKAHLVGASMGGMIAQTLALSHPDRILSLTSIMSTTGNPRLPDGDASVRIGIMKKPKSESMEDMVADMEAKITMICHPQKPSGDLKGYCERVLTRSYHPVGAARQMNAILVPENRTEQLKELGPKMPCLIVHGAQDSLVPLAHGLATADAIGGDRKVLVIQEMGHVMVGKFNGEVVDAIKDNCDRAADYCVGVADVKVSLETE